MVTRNCPHCKVSLTGEEIPDELKHHYGEGVTHYGREIGMEYPELYDGVWEWKCPDCDGTWPSAVQILRTKYANNLAE